MQLRGGAIYRQLAKEVWEVVHSTGQAQQVLRDALTVGDVLAKAGESHILERFLERNILPSRVAIGNRDVVTLGLSYFVVFHTFGFEQF